MSIFSKRRLDELNGEAPQAAVRPLVLLVDDEPANLLVMRTLLEERYQLLEAADGREALELIASLPEPERLDCIVSDQRMPRLTGVELFTHLALCLPATPRIVVTGFVDIATIIDSINKAHIYQFIVKPFDRHDFVLTVQRAVEARLLQREVAAYQQQLEHKVEQRTRELQASAAQILALYNNASCGYHSLDRDGVFVHINDTELGWLGRRREDVVGKLKFSDVITADSRNALLARFPVLAIGGWLTALKEVEVEIRHADGHAIPVLLNAATISDLPDEAPALARYTVFDITRRKRDEERVRHQAHHDMLTGLPNRVLMQERARQALSAAQRDGGYVALVFIDLDKFKQINDTLGHHIGDRLLVEAAERLRHCVRHSDTVTRLGGDEFVLILPMLSDHAPVHAIASKVVHSLAQPFHIDGHLLEISVSAGISLYPDHGTELDSLIELADATMYRAKTGGRNRYLMYQA